jgi:hypothetical protein
LQFIRLGLAQYTYKHVRRAQPRIVRYVGVAQLVYE